MRYFSESSDCDQCGCEFEYDVLSDKRFYVFERVLQWGEEVVDYSREDYSWENRELCEDCFDKLPDNT